LIPPDAPRAYPYGIYDLKANTAFVNVGTDHDTSRFAVASIRAGWEVEGSAAYPKAEYMLILADGGGSPYCHRRLPWRLKFSF
jgi:hypothetical protein